MKFTCTVHLPAEQHCYFVFCMQAGVSGSWWAEQSAFSNLPERKPSGRTQDASLGGVSRGAVEGHIPPIFVWLLPSLRMLLFEF